MVKGNRLWVNLETKNPSEAVKRVQEIQVNPIVKNHGTSLEHDLERYLGYQQRTGKYSPRSISDKRPILKHFINSLPENTTLVNINPRHIEDYCELLRTENISKDNDRVKHRTHNTIMGYLGAIRVFMRWAVEVERVRVTNPVPRPEFEKSGIRILWCDKALKNKLITEAPNDELRFILHCGFDAGLRRNEIVESRRDWFDLKHGMIYVRKAKGDRLREGERSFLIKDKEERAIPLTPTFKAFLKEYLKGLDPLDFVLYADLKHRKWRYRYDFRRPFTEYMKSQKCEWVTPHVMRHSFASILASRGVSIYKIAEWLGDDVRVVQHHYAKLAKGDKDIHVLS